MGRIIRTYQSHHTSVFYTVIIYRQHYITFRSLVFILQVGILGNALIDTTRPLFITRLLARFLSLNYLLSLHNMTPGRSMHLVIPQEFLHFPFSFDLFIFNNGGWSQPQQEFVLVILTRYSDDHQHVGSATSEGTCSDSPSQLAHWSSGSRCFSQSRTAPLLHLAGKSSTAPQRKHWSPTRQLRGGGLVATASG